MLKYSRLEIAPMRHYHIQWSGKDELDWEAFDSLTDAQIAAGQLVRPGESYTVEERGENCPRCRTALNLKMPPQPEAETKPKYEWQLAVREAFKAPAETLHLRVNAAQRAISARLCGKASTDLYEQIAIREALHSLQELLPEQSPKENDEDRPGEKRSA